MQVVQSELYKIMDNPQLITAMADEPANDEERSKLAVWLIAGMRQREFDWMQYRDGSIDEATYQSYVGVIRILLGTEATRKWWKTVGSTAFNPDFVVEVDGLLDNAPYTEFFRKTLSWE